MVLLKMPYGKVAVTLGHPSGAEVESFGFHEIGADLLRLVTRSQAVLPAHILQDGKRLRKLHVIVDVVRDLQ